MKLLIKKALAGFLASGLILSMAPAKLANAQGIPAPAGYTSPYARYGNVKVATDSSTGYQQLCDSAGNPVQLKGMSTFGLQWADGYWVLNDEAFDALAYDWHCDIIRLAMYVSEGGYASNPADCLERVETGIRLATERGMYVLVDWHMLSPGDPTASVYTNAGVDLPQYADIRAAHPEYTGPQLFFAYLSQKYGAQGNVLFETANEPNGNGGEANAVDTWTSKLLPYHQGVVNAIREYDADDIPNIVICGTDNWSQFVDAPIANPVVDPAVQVDAPQLTDEPDADVSTATDTDPVDDQLNTAPTGASNQIMYTFHFYAGTHDTAPNEEGEYWLGSKIQNALDGGLAVFCTEWGTSEATGDGGPYINYSERWLNFLASKKISWCSWSLALKNEISAAMQGKAAKNPTDLDGDGIPNWSTAPDDSNTDLSITGNYVRSKIRGEQAPLYGADELITDFEDGLPIATVLGDSPVAAADYPLEVANLPGDNKALQLGQAAGGVWGGPRISFQDLGNVYSLYSDITFDVYLPEGSTLVNDKLEIQPIIQTEALDWWGQLSQITLTSNDFALDEESGLMKATTKVNYDDKKAAGDKLGHITLLIGDTNGFYLDNLALETWYNGDIADAPVIPDNPGTFIDLPFDFEDGQREGWKPEGSSTIDYNTISIDEVGEGNYAMSFPVKLEAGKNEWEDGVRLSSPMGIFDLDECKTFKALTMDIYLEKGKATDGEIKIAVCSIPNGDGYWYQSGEITLDPVNDGTAVTTPGGRELVKYQAYVPLNNSEDDFGVYPFSDNVAIRNVILALHNADSDYEGRVYYDNIQYVTTDKPAESQIEEGQGSSNPDDTKKDDSKPALGGAATPEAESTEKYKLIAAPLIWNIGDPDVTFIVKAVGDLDDSFEKFSGVKLDGNALTLGTDYEVKKGSTIVTVKASVLEKAGVGDHIFTFDFADGNITAKMGIDPKATEVVGTASGTTSDTTSATSQPTSTVNNAVTTASPITGDVFNPAMIFIIMFVSLACVTFIIKSKRDNSEE